MRGSEGPEVKLKCDKCKYVYSFPKGTDNPNYQPGTRCACLGQKGVLLPISPPDESGSDQDEQNQPDLLPASHGAEPTSEVLDQLSLLSGTSRLPDEP